eukprot:TRINITY_DN10144_c0_g1_i2.p1 TRINITY_DN10144_c0_g1~~TRINITY_DN10144_c0_g1_i2.p1  ORF type:complete len:278 (-),score=55.03 TRINITY_DN10144_c0_g1_i2:117-950(-)
MMFEDGSKGTMTGDNKEAELGNSNIFFSDNEDEREENNKRQLNIITQNTYKFPTFFSFEEEQKAVEELSTNLIQESEKSEDTEQHLQSDFIKSDVTFENSKLSESTIATGSKRIRKKKADKDQSSQAPNKNILKNHDKNMIIATNQIPSFKEVVKQLAEDNSMQVKDVKAFLSGINKRKNYSFQAVWKIWNGKKIEIDDKDFSKEANVKKLKKIASSMAVPMNRITCVYLKKYAVNSIFNGKTRNSKANMISTVQHLHKGISYKTEWGYHRTLLSES